MIEWIAIFYLLVGCLAGMGLGAFYFGTLWATVRHLPESRRPALLSLGSFLGRLAVLLVGFYLIMGEQWERLLAGVLGFLVVRKLFTSRLRPQDRPLSPKRG